MSSESMLGVGLRGQEELARELQLLSDKTQNQIARKAIRKGNKIILALMVANVPRNSGELAEILGERVVISRRTKMAFGFVGPLVTKKRSGKVTAAGKRLAKKGIEDTEKWRIAHLVEFGHGGPAPAPPHPFARPTRDQGAAQAESAMVATAETELTKLWAGH